MGAGTLPRRPRPGQDDTSNSAAVGRGESPGSCGRGEDRGGPGRPPPLPRRGQPPPLGVAACVLAVGRDRKTRTGRAWRRGVEERGGGDIFTLWPFVPQSVAGCAPRSRSLCVWEETMPGGGGGVGSWSTAAVLAVRCPSLATGPFFKERPAYVSGLPLMAGSIYSTVRDEPQVRGSPGAPAANNVEAFAVSRLVADSVRLSLGGTSLARETYQRESMLDFKRGRWGVGGRLSLAWRSGTRVGGSTRRRHPRPCRWRGGHRERVRRCTEQCENSGVLRHFTNWGFGGRSS